MPTNRRSVTIMSNSGAEMSKYSDTVRGDSFYGYADGLHTIQTVYDQYVGRFRIQGTLSIDPQTEDDWFDIIPGSTTGKSFNTGGYIQFNADKPASGSEAYTFQGNFTHIRTFMDRRHMADGITYDPSYGSVNTVILSS